MSHESSYHHIVKYGFYVKILLALLVLTGLTVSITFFDLGALTVIAALVIAGIKVTLVLLYFMHLKFDKKLFGFMVAGVLVLFLAVVFVTFLDYYFR